MLNENQPNRQDRRFNALQNTESQTILHSVYLGRSAEEVLMEILTGDKVGIILGARRVGKTTLVEHVLAVQMGRPTVDRYLALLEQTFVIFRLPSFST